MKPCLLIIFLFTLNLYAQQKAYIITENANLRTLPNSGAPIITTIPANTQILVKSATSLNGWYEISIGKKSGWLHGNTFSFDKPDLQSDSVYQRYLEGWKYIGETEDYRMFYLPKTLKTDDFHGTSIWMRSFPTHPKYFPPSGRNRHRIAYMMQYFTVDCSSHRYSLESTTLYDINQKIINFPSILVDKYRMPILPGSAGEAMINILCN